MTFRSVARLAALLAVVQVLLVAGSWWLITGSHLPETPGRAPASAATQRLAELQAQVASRAVVTFDQAALNELIRQSHAWPEVAYVSVEDPQAKILAHTDPTKVGTTWNERLASQMRATIKAPYEEVAVPLTDAGGGKGAAVVGRFRLGFIVQPGSPVTGSEPAAHELPAALPLALLLAVAVITAIPVAAVAAWLARTRSTVERRSASHESARERFADDLKDAHEEAQRARNELAKVRGERDHHAAEAGNLRSELDKLRVDAIRIEADAEPAPREPRQELKRIQARTVTHIARAFRSSLTNVVGYSKLLLRGADGTLSEPQQVNVAHILEAGSRLAALVNGLSAYVRVDAGVYEMTPEIIDVGPCLDEVAAESPRDGRLQVSTVSAPDPLLVKVDRRHLAQILRALAIDAMALDPKANGMLSGSPRNDAVVVELVLAEFHTAFEDLGDVLELFASDDLSHPLDEAHLRLALARCLAEANGAALRVETRGPGEAAFVLEIPAATAVLAVRTT
jgi:signal transduction histidine kinase